MKVNLFTKPINNNHSNNTVNSQKVEATSFAHWRRIKICITFVTLSSSLIKFSYN